MIHQFGSFREAVNYLLDLEDGRSNAAFTVSYVEVAAVVQCILDNHMDGSTATLPLTRALAEALAYPDNMEALEVGSEAHYGYILVSSTNEGAPVSVFAFE